MLFIRDSLKIKLFLLLLIKYLKFEFDKSDVVYTAHKLILIFEKQVSQ
jgi:hypothetical protein